MKFIVVKDPGRNDEIQDFFPNGRREAYALSGIDIDWDKNTNPQFRAARTYEIEDMDEQEAVQAISEWHPGKEIYVLVVDKLFQRAPGILTEIKLSKEGKLPI